MLEEAVTDGSLLDVDIAGADAESDECASDEN